ncbi:hypothetical protein ANN_06387 [Periplaneta americana]|uniref:Reverse transcriptase domain-containing protein n=1 Tax=Periplaneta americana TaxID=6978 RepID=A0ABQ8TEN9_PERAM|nr:hypothetical protein ANN_06387 [Periplaneta americana]
MYKSVQVVVYADDLDIMGRSKAKVEEILKDLEKTAGKIGLNINNSKTKWMIQSRNTLTSNQQIGSERFETTKDFKYLGPVIANDKKEWTDIQTGMTKGNQTYFALLAILKSGFVHKITKFRIYTTMIRTVLCYRCETWVMNNKIESALGAFERKIMRRIVGPVNENGQWRIRYNQEVMEQYRDMDVVTHINSEDCNHWIDLIGRGE